MNVFRLGTKLALASVLVVVTLQPTQAASAGTATLVDPQREADNYSLQNERSTYGYEAPQVEVATARASADGIVSFAGLVLRDPQRLPVTVCGTHVNGCAGDVRVYRWGSQFGLAVPVTWVNRYGAVISGTLWQSASRRAQLPRRQPVVVMTAGGTQEPEIALWDQAQNLAAHGYQVLTWDPQGQGRSATAGTGAAGIPSEQYHNFVVGLEDAIDFVMSTPRAPYRPQPDPSTPAGSAQARQDQRVALGLSPVANPLASSADRSELGVAGHSFGAIASSEVAGVDHRVKAVVAYDYLASSVCDVYEVGIQDFCPGEPRRALKIRVPGLSVSDDYTFANSPNVTVPDPTARTMSFPSYESAGIDTMQVVVRGGTHYECPYIPNEAFGATLYGIDLCGWYSLAWFDKYLRHDPTADARLLTSRWRADQRSAALDPSHDANMLSSYYLSRVAIHLTSGRFFTCDDLRHGCPGMVPRNHDCWVGDFDVVAARARRMLSSRQCLKRHR